MISIAVIGCESSGKTDLCEFLSKQFNAILVPEFSREYLKEKGPIYNMSDLDKIARGQSDAIQGAKVNKPDLIISDTEALVVKIWSLIKYGSVSREIEALVQAQYFDLYLLCAPDLPWEFDPLREVPLLEDRLRIHEHFIKELDNLKWPYLLVSGQDFSRYSLSVKYIQDSMK